MDDEDDNDRISHKQENINGRYTYISSRVDNREESVKLAYTTSKMIM